ncbi:hypothetical protein HYV57_05860 [Candidatus Peregrinibacteria bacterium]|nr:hypothetical protein [Candidatus Peregrinibacteria bacterium]
MPRFKYTAVNQQNKKISGIIHASAETDARQELNVLGFSILHMEIAPEKEEKTDETIQKLKFEALDKSGKKILGSIRSINILQAYTRLTDEYKFTVTALYPENSTEEIIQKARNIEIISLKRQYQENKKLPEQRKEEERSKKYENQREKLMVEVDIIIAFAKKVVDEYTAILSSDARTEIKKNIDKLLRLKTSGNLAYIKQTADEILIHIQNPAIFESPELQFKEHIFLKIKAKTQLKELNRALHRKAPWREETVQKIKQWQEANINNVEKPNFIHRLINTLFDYLLQKWDINDTTKELQKEIKKIHGELFEYAQIWLKGDTESKKIVQPLIRELWNKRKNLKRNFIHETLIQKKYGFDTSFLKNLMYELNTFTGWLLTFYLLYYFVALYAVTKNFGIEPSSRWLVFHSRTFKMLLASIFILHGSLSIKIQFFPRSSFAAIIILPLSISAILFVIYNF